jgi:two-component system chemotaxis response regulator CheB
VSDASRRATRTVLVVDDSATMRELVKECVRATPGFRVVGEARDGLDGLARMHALDPDIVTLDIHMPALDGLQALGYIMSESPRPVVVLSGLGATSGGALAVRALELGAVDVVAKPSSADATGVAELRARLAAALRAAAHADVETSVRRVGLLARPPIAPEAGVRIARGETSRVVAIASSTGGPRALAEVIPRLPASLGAAVLVAQHIPAGFSASLAARLDGMSALRVREALDGEPVLDDHVYLAPGGRHLVVRRDGDSLRLALDEAPPRHGVRPSADALFESVAEACGPAAVGVVLTGMGRDGAEGLRRMRERGGRAVVQDSETSVVRGMPEAARRAAGADVIAPLSGVASAILDCLAATRIVSSGEPVSPPAATAASES